MSEQQLLEKINELKIRIKEIVIDIQGIKGKLERSAISLEEFRTQKTVLEEELRNILQKIAEIKEETEFKKSPIEDKTSFQKNEESLSIEEKDPQLEEAHTQLEQEPTQLEEESTQIEKESIPKEDGTTKVEVSTSELVDKEILIAGEAKDLMYYFQTEFIESVSNAKIYLSITLEDHFIIGINFYKYPERPILDIPTKVLVLFNNDLLKFYASLPVYLNWDIENPGRIYELVTEIETVLINMHNADVNTILQKSVELIDKKKEKLVSLIKSVNISSKNKDYERAAELCYSIIDLASELQYYETIETYTRKLNKFIKKKS